MKRAILTLTVLALLLAFPLPALAKDERRTETVAVPSEQFPDLRAPGRGAEAELQDGEDAELYQTLKERIEPLLLSLSPDGPYSIEFECDCRADQLWEPLRAAYYNAVYNHPEALYFLRTAMEYSYSWYNSNPTHLYITLTPGVFGGLDGAAFRAAVDRVCLEVFGSADPSESGMTELEKVAAAHDYIAATTRYDPVIGNSDEAQPTSWVSPGGDTFYLSDNVYSPYGVFVDHNAVCQGYSLALKVLLDRAGVECCYVTSNPLSHGWNMVRVEGSWYHVDCTWDDPIHKYSGCYDLAGWLVRDDFLISDATRLQHIKNKYIVPDGLTLWTTEETITAPADYALPAALSGAAELPVFRWRDSLYVFSGAALRSYATGSGFSAVQQTRSLAASHPDAAAFDAKSGTVYYANSTFGKTQVYRLNPDAGTDEYFDRADRDGCGLYFRPTDAPGQSALIATFGYREIQRWTLEDQSCHHPSLTWIEETAPTCTEPGHIAHWACPDCGKLFLDDTAATPVTPEDVAVPTTDHPFGQPVWTWSEDHSAAEAAFRCAVCGLERTETATVSEATTPPTCTLEGSTVYTASVTVQESVYTDTQSVTIPASGHSYLLPVWTWSEDHSSASAEFLCAEGDDQLVLPATVTAETDPPTCTMEGLAFYTASVELQGETYTDKIMETLPIVDHDWGEWEIVTEPGYRQPGLRQRVCRYDSEHTHTQTEVLPALEEEELAWTAERAEGSATVTVQGRSGLRCRIIVAVYSTEGRLLRIEQRVIVSDGTASLTVLTDGADRLKCFALWSDSDSTPVAPVFDLIL